MYLYKSSSLWSTNAATEPLHQSPMRLDAARYAAVRASVPRHFFFSFPDTRRISTDLGRFTPNQVISAKTAEIGWFRQYQHQYGRFRPKFKLNIIKKLLKKGVKRTVSTQAFKQKSLNSLPFCFSIFAFLSLSAMCSLPKTISKSHSHTHSQPLCSLSPPSPSLGFKFQLSSSPTQLSTQVSKLSFSVSHPPLYSHMLYYSLCFDFLNFFI